MSLEFLNHIGHTAGQLFRHPLTRTHLPVPDRLLVKPADIWPGDPRIGQALMDGTFTHHGDVYAFPNPFDTNIWKPFGISQNWLFYINSFSWLRDLQACISTEAHNAGFTLIDNWIHHHQAPCKDQDSFNSWSPDLIAERLCNWISHFESFMAETPEEPQEQFFLSLSNQANHLHKSIFGTIRTTLGSSVQGIALLRALKGLVYTSLALEGREQWLEQTLELLTKELPAQIGKDGCHISRSPAHTLETLQILLDIRRALSAGGHKQPVFLQPVIDALAQATRFFRTADKGFAQFNGSQEEDPLLIASTLSQAGPKGKIFQSLPQGGYERLSLGRTLAIFDSGNPPPHPHDKNAHSAPLSFELYYGKERIFVNCGSHKTNEEWQDSLRFTAAHNTLSLDHRNAYEIKENHRLGRKAHNIQCFRQDGKEYHLVEAAHDGYVPLNGLKHHRRLYLGGKGYDFRGEDTLESAISARPPNPHSFAIRFHIHPRVMVSLIKNGEAALLRLPSGIGWRFQCSGGMLSLENSIYLAEGLHPRKTKQLVISGETKDCQTTVKWALQREGV